MKNKQNILLVSILFATLLNNCQNCNNSRSNTTSQATYNYLLETKLDSHIIDAKNKILSSVNSHIDTTLVEMLQVEFKLDGGDISSDSIKKILNDK